MKKTVSTCSLLFMLFIAANSSNAACPDLTGSWTRPTDGLRISFSKKERSTFIPPTPFAPGRRIIKETLAGHAMSSSFDFSFDLTCRDSSGNFGNNGTYVGNITRVSSINGCVTKMTAKFRYLPHSGNMQGKILGTDGNCDLPTTYTETNIWNKL